MKRYMTSVFVLLVSLLFFGGTALAEEARLLRHPHISGNSIVFVYGGDLWRVDRDGGEAKKLTSFAGVELFPRLSPDGNWIAFSGEYAGSRQIYLIPSEGGEPKQLTFYPDVGPMPPRGGWDNIPMDWTPDGKMILVRSNRTPYGERTGRYFLIDPFNGGLEQPLQIPEGAHATLSPAGDKLAYSIKSREFRTWKRYKAGRAQDIWIYDLKKDAIERITTYEGTDNFPMWVGDTIYFTSDRLSVDSDEPRTLNLFAYDLTSGKMRKATNFTEYDCLWPSRGAGAVVFENGGYIYLLDTASDVVKKVPVEINHDRPQALPLYKNVAKYIDGSYLSPSGKRAIFSARGDVFTVPAEHGDIRNITETPGTREFNVDWSPDGKYISYLSEKPGDYELFIQEYAGDEKPVQLTEKTGSWITGYMWSPDSKMILFKDKKNRLLLVDIETKGITSIDRGIYASIGGLAWSSDSSWIAYTKDAANHSTSIWLYSLDKKESRQLTGDMGDEYSPVFDPDGKYLYFVSRRDFNWSERKFESKLYAGTLRADLESPFAPRNDDEKPDEKKEDSEKSDDNKKGKKDKDKDDKDKKEKLKIDIDGFDQRIVAFPVKVGHYGGLTAIENGLLYMKDGALYKFDMKEREEKQIMEKISSYILAAKGEKFLYKSGESYGIADVKPKQKPGEGKLDLKRMEMKISPEEEWTQIYHDAWRIVRDWFYDPGMHGVDWKKMHDRYAVLVPHLAHRADLDYILGELIGELNAGHTYVFPGDAPAVERIPVGVLGCELVPDGEFYRIAEIFPGENWDAARRSPLTMPGVNVKEGEYILAIDGETVTTDMNPYRLLEKRVDVDVVLLVNDKPKEKGAREVTVRPVKSELNLRHLAWKKRNREIVDKLSGGRVGYIYVPNTSFDGFKSFFRGWYEQSTKDGLIIDDRYNGGGYLPSDMVFAMAHPLLQYWARRNLELYSTPYFFNEGPKVMLVNGLSSSGGDAFPDYFRTMKLGPLMGQTTWGGLIGYGYSPSFVDGGGMAVPSSGYVNRKGEWDVEYYGVKPDIEVFDDPTLIQQGREPMLEEAVKYILKELEKNPPVKVTKPEGPDRS